jgi:hypothetical protein
MKKAVILTIVLSCALGLSVAAQESLGSVRIGRAVMADGKPLAAGTYQLRVTTQQAAPPAVGQTPQYERWVEFVQGGQVRGREVLSVVPDSEIAQVADRGAPRNSARVELLKGEDYLRVWINRAGNHYLVHLPVAKK